MLSSFHWDTKGLGTPPLSGKRYVHVRIHLSFNFGQDPPLRNATLNENICLNRNIDIKLKYDGWLQVNINRDAYLRVHTQVATETIVVVSLDSADNLEREDC